MFKDPDDVEAKTGRDDDLEADANKLLAEGVRENKRSLERDIEKMQYESGLIGQGEFDHYDPLNDWDTQDSAYAIPVDDIGLISPSECNGCGEWDVNEDGESVWSATDDGNSRSRNRRMQERQALMQHIDEDSDWGSTSEAIPILGTEAERKICRKCNRAKRLEFFSPDPRNKDGRHAWCKACRKQFTSQKRERRKRG